MPRGGAPRRRPPKRPVKANAAVNAPAPAPSLLRRRHSLVAVARRGPALPHRVGARSVRARWRHPRQTVPMDLTTPSALHTTERPRLGARPLQTLRTLCRVACHRLLTPAEVRSCRREAERQIEMTSRRFPTYRAITFQSWRASRAFRHAALDSAAPRLAAQAMGLPDSSARPQPLRVMKDAMMALMPGDTGCGWHVDDKVCRGRGAFMWSAPHTTLHKSTKNATNRSHPLHRLPLATALIACRGP